ncbi:hypothetical protein QL285_074612 [Trifolium repens]|nr:hypothetical protein QL285_074612 [Trifolium repens]
MPQMHLIRRHVESVFKWRVFISPELQMECIHKSNFTKDILLKSIHKSKAKKTREKTMSDQFDLIIKASFCFSNHSVPWHECRSRYHVHKKGFAFLRRFDTIVDLEYFVKVL